MFKRSDKKIPLLKLVFGAAIFSWEKRYDLARSLWLPFLFGLVLSLTDSFQFGDQSLSEAGSANGYSFNWLYFAMAAMFFVTVIASVRAYRVLLESESIHSLPISWGQSETKFTLAMFAIAFVFLFVLALTSSLLMSILAVYENIGALAMLNFLPPIYIAARLILVFPEVSCRPDVSLFEAFKWSWSATRGHGLILMFLAVILPLLIALGINWFSMTSIPASKFIGAVLVWLVLPFEVALISLSYSSIKKWVKQTNDNI